MAGSGPLSGKTALVTGASVGIGFASATRLAEDGAAVVLMARGAPALEQARVRLLEAAPQATVETFCGDAADEQAVLGAIERAHGLAGRLDVLVAAVGGGGFKPLLQQDAVTFRQEFELNVMSAFFMIRHGAPLMTDGGAIVCVSAAPVVQPFTGLGTYLSSKAALERLVSSAGDELGPLGVRVNAVRPGLTVTQATVDFFGGSDLFKAFIERIPLGRAGEPDDIGRVVRFLAGPESGWVTGQTFTADGGQSQRQVPDLLYEAFGKAAFAELNAGLRRAAPAAR